MKGKWGADLEVEPALRLPRRGSPVHRAAAVHLFRSPAARGQGTARSREDRQILRKFPWLSPTRIVNI